MATSRVRRACTLLLGLCLLVALSVLGLSQCSHPDRQDADAPKLVASPQPVLSAEDLVKEVAATGEGRIKVSPQPDGPGRTREVRHLGPLSERAKARIDELIQKWAKEQERLLELAEFGDGKNELSEFSYSMECLRRLEEFRVMREMLHEGTYITFATGGFSVSSSMTDLADYSISPVTLADGSTANVVFLIDRKKRPSTEALADSIRETILADRQQQIVQWTALPYAARQAQVLRYFELEEKAKGGLLAMAEAEVRELLAERVRLEYLRAHYRADSFFCEANG